MKNTASAQVVSFPTARKSRPKTATRKPRASKRQPGVVEQVRTAFHRKNALATSIGLVFGGFVPVATYYVSHHEVAASAHGYAMLALVIGGLVFSAKTVWQWARAAFADPWKATGFVVLLEGVMTLSGQGALAVAALTLLTAVNAIATGVTLSRA